VASPRSLLRKLARTDRRGAVWCAVLCATSVAHLVPLGESRPGRVRLLAAAWAVELPVSEVRLRAAADAAAATARATRTAANAAHVANAAAYATALVAAWADAAHPAIAVAVDAVLDCAIDAIDASVRERHLAALAALVEHQITPLVPSARNVAAARPGPAVVWDTAAEAIGPVRLGTLGDALARARRLRLRWHDPVERAIAERLPLDHPALGALRRTDDFGGSGS
jgi:hypothetical protein